MGTLRTAMANMTKLQTAMLVTGVGAVFFAGLACGALVERTVEHFKTPTNTSVSVKAEPIKAKPIKAKPVKPKGRLIRHPVSRFEENVSRMECLKGYLFILSSNGDVEQFFKTNVRSSPMPMACKEGDR